MTAFDDWSDFELDEAIRTTERSLEGDLIRYLSDDSINAQIGRVTRLKRERTRRLTVDYTTGLRHKGTLYRAVPVSSTDREQIATETRYIASAYPQRGVTYEVIVNDVMTPFAPRQLRPWA
jgi:hypothetical protein